MADDNHVGGANVDGNRDRGRRRRAANRDQNRQVVPRQIQRSFNDIARFVSNRQDQIDNLQNQVDDLNERLEQQQEQLEQQQQQLEQQQQRLEQQQQQLEQQQQQLEQQQQQHQERLQQEVEAQIAAQFQRVFRQQIDAQVEERLNQERVIHNRQLDRLRNLDCCQESVDEARTSIQRVRDVLQEASVGLDSFGQHRDTAHRQQVLTN